MDIVDTWNRSEKRLRKSQISIQCTTYRIRMSTFECTISAIYIVPDASLEAKKALFEHKVELEMKYPNYMSLGDYNMDAKKLKIRDFFKSHCGGHLTQIVKGTTRKKSRKVGSRERTSETTIDLIFMSSDIKSKMISKCEILTDSPSDHYMVEFLLDVKTPLKYAVKEYFLDKTRRPPIPKNKLDIVRNEIRTTLETSNVDIASLSQDEHLAFILETVKASLDKHNPLNREGKLVKHIYRFTLSKKAQDLMHETRLARNAWRFACRKKLNCATIHKRREAFKNIRNKKNALVNLEKTSQCAAKIYDGIKNSSCVWEILRKFLPDPHFKPLRQKLEINGKTGIELANHMANFFRERAHLVSDENAADCSESIPFPVEEWSDQLDIDNTIVYDVKKLFKGKKKPTLAAGPDTVSHRHICDLMPVLEDSLQQAIDKPLLKFSNITDNFVRLLDKEKVNIDTTFTEKSQRPITELNVLPKYGSIKVFVDQLRSMLMKRMNKNQFAFPGKGGPLATSEILDFVSYHASSGKKVLLVTWDFSNAFCTTIHKIITEIAKKFNLSDRVVELLKQFLEQTFSSVKMSDKEGFYISESIDLVRGTPQGQVGSDFIFAMVNDSITPEKVLDEIILRVKYVDDFNDVYVSDTVEGVFKSLKHNELRLKAQATSVGLKLNMDKLNIIPLNINRSEYDPEYLTRGPKSSSVYTDEAKILGFKFCVTNPSSNMIGNVHELMDPILNPENQVLRKSKSNRNSKISAEPAGKNMIARLNEAIRTISTLRKFETNIVNKVDAATALVWSNAYDIGLIYAYCGEKSNIWHQVCITIKRLLKASGLDYMTNSNILYKVTLKFDPASMAKKQILQAGIKTVSKECFNSRSFKLSRKYGDELEPFRYKFLVEYNNLPKNIREYIFEKLDALDQSVMDRIKDKLKSHFITEFDPECPATSISKEKRRALLNRNLYSQAKIQKRKRAAEIEKTAKAKAQIERKERECRKLLKTPKQRRKVRSETLQTPAVIRFQRRCRAPLVEPSSKRCRIGGNCTTPVKRSRESGSQRSKRPRFCAFETAHLPIKEHEGLNLGRPPDRASLR